MSKKNGGKVIQMLSPENYIRTKGRTLPVYECTLNSDWEESRMAQLSIARQHSNGNITVCFFLVDLMCLGVKETFFLFNESRSLYLEKIEEINSKMPVDRVSYALVHNIVFAGLEFAEEYGFKPHKDFTSTTRFMLEEDTDDIELLDIECGLDDKPAYMKGPYDDTAKVNRIVAQLEKSAGRGNYTIVDTPEEGDFDDDEFDDDEFDDDEFDDDEFDDDEFDDDEFDDDEFDDDEFDDDEFDDDGPDEDGPDEDEFAGIPFNEKKELFNQLINREEKMTEEEHWRFIDLTDSILNNLIDFDLHDQYVDEFLSELTIPTNEEEIPDQLLGITDKSLNIQPEVKLRFLKIHQMIGENPKKVAKELKIFEKEVPDIPATAFLELMFLQAEDLKKYPKKVKEYALKYPDYQIIRVLWACEQVVSGTDPQKIEGYPFKWSEFFPRRNSLHPIEIFQFLTMIIFSAAQENNIDRIAALDSAIEELDLPEEEYHIFSAILAVIRINFLREVLKQ